MRCGASCADFLHAAWYCRGIADFWVQVTEMLTEVVQERVPCAPEVCLLGCVTSLKPCNRRLVAVSTLLAKRAVAIHWGARTRPTIGKWLRDLVYGQEQLAIYFEDLPASSCQKDFWAPLTQYLLCHSDLRPP